MSFAQEVRSELCGAKLSCKHCRRSLLYGMLTFSRNRQEQQLFFESRTVASFCAQQLAEELGVIADCRPADQRRGVAKSGYAVTLPGAEDWERLFSAIPLSAETLDQSLFSGECCRVAFLRGAFLTCGTMADPQKEYHLEYTLPEDTPAQDLLALLNEEGRSFRQTKRQKYTVLYLKESNLIEEMLTFLGASHSAMNLMNLKIEKEIRNAVNRATNCETANIGKTVNAAQVQIATIRRLRETVGLEELPTDMQELAVTRLLNPEASLRELCALYNGRYTRNALHYRLGKLVDTCEKILAESEKIETEE